MAPWLFCAMAKTGAARDASEAVCGELLIFDANQQFATHRSLDRFYLETDFSKSHLSQILRGKRSPSLATMTKLAKVLNVRVAEFFRPV